MESVAEAAMPSRSRGTARQMVSRLRHSAFLEATPLAFLDLLLDCGGKSPLGARL